MQYANSNKYLEFFQNFYNLFFFNLKKHTVYIEFLYSLYAVKIYSFIYSVYAVKMYSK